MSRHSVIGLSALALASLGASPAAGCSLAFQTPRQRVASADRAVFGHVLWVHFASAADPAPGRAMSPNRRFVAKLAVNRIYKGRTSRSVRISGATDGASCGFGVLRPRQALGLLLERPGPPYAVFLGSRISRTDLGRTTGGHFRRPPR